MNFPYPKNYLKDLTNRGTQYDSSNHQTTHLFLSKHRQTHQLSKLWNQNHQKLQQPFVKLSGVPLDKAKNNLEKVLLRLIEKGRIDESEKGRIQTNIIYVNQLQDLSEADLIIEAIVSMQNYFL